MTDKLKQFIEVNRAAFDREEPDPRLFKRLQKQKLQVAKSNSFLNRTSLRWAAAVTGLILVSAILYSLLRKEETTHKEYTGLPPVNMEEMTGISDPVYAKEIYHFRELIGLKQEELKQLKKEYPDLYNQFVGDINELDSSYQALKINLANNPNRELLIEAMIQNLQLQSDLLNQQLLIIKEIKQKSKRHEKNTI